MHSYSEPLPALEEWFEFLKFSQKEGFQKEGIGKRQVVLRKGVIRYFHAN